MGPEPSIGHLVTRGALWWAERGLQARWGAPGDWGSTGSLGTSVALGLRGHIFWKCLMNTGSFTEQTVHWGAELSARHEGSNVLRAGPSFLACPLQRINRLRQGDGHHPVRQADGRLVPTFVKHPSSPLALPKDAPGSGLSSPTPPCP